MILGIYIGGEDLSVMPQVDPQLPKFVAAHQAAQQALKQQLRRQALQRVRQLTNEGRHLEANALWQEEISA